MVIQYCVVRNMNMLNTKYVVTRKHFFKNTSELLENVEEMFLCCLYKRVGKCRRKKQVVKLSTGSRDFIYIIDTFDIETQFDNFIEISYGTIKDKLQLGKQLKQYM